MAYDLEKLIEFSKDLTLLYVEDNEDAKAMTSMILEDFFGEIITAENGLEGFEKFEQNHIDVIITDINMPVMNGLEMVEKIRKVDNDVPILILSAHNEDDLFLKSIKLGVDGYILKPTDFDQLVGQIERVVKKSYYLKEAKENLFFLEEYQKIANISSIISKTDTKGIITFVNDRFCDISGYTKEELIGKNHNIVRHPDNPKEIFADMWHTIKEKKQIWQGIVRNKTKNNKSYYVDSVVMPVLDLDGNIIEYISMRNDITEIMSPIRQLSDAIKNAQNVVLVYFKLENYNDLVEFYENDVVEEIENAVGKYLEKRLEEHFEFDKVYQLANGEYSIILNKNDLKEQIEFVKELRTLQKEINNEHIAFDDIKYDIKLVMSCVCEGEKPLESVRLGIRRAMKNKEDFVVANNLASIEYDRAKENMKKISLIKNAIINSRIISFFQPIIDNKTQEIVKYESLVRLIDEDNNILTPYFFLETAKKSNYYTQITNIVLEHSFSILKNCDKEISINLSAIDIEQKSTRKKVYELLEAHKQKASKVVFELLESEDIKDFNIIKEFIEHVKGYGVKIAIDDFGAGYSNYERLLSYQPDILKIDGCLIRDIETSTYSYSVVKSIVTFAKEQGLQTVAEFIENENIFKIVKELGVDYSQGYYFGKPAPLGE